MNKQKTVLATTALLITCSAYLLTETQNTHIVPLTTKHIEQQTNQTDSVVLIDTTNIKHQAMDSDAQKQPVTEPNRFYSRTFSTTEEYESTSRFGDLPPHMSDVRIEELAFDATGALIIDENIKHLIEFFLLAQDIEGRDQAIERLKEYLELTLPTPAKEQAIAISEQYILYKNNLKTQQFSDNTNLSDEANLADIKVALDERKKARREYLGDKTSQAIFGYEERYDDFSFQRLEINANTDLSPSEKDQLISQAEQQLPPRLAEKMRYQRESKAIEKKISALKQGLGNEVEIFQLRKNIYGEKAAERLAYLEEQSPVWQQRVNNFYQDVQSIKADSSLSESQKSDQINTLKNQSFTYKEQVKMAVQSIRG